MVRAPLFRGLLPLSCGLLPLDSSSGTTTRESPSTSCVSHRAWRRSMGCMHQSCTSCAPKADYCHSSQLHASNNARGRGKGLRASIVHDLRSRTTDEAVVHSLLHRGSVRPAFSVGRLQSRVGIFTVNPDSVSPRPASRPGVFLSALSSRVRRCR